MDTNKCEPVAISAEIRAALSTEYATLTESPQASQAFAAVLEHARENAKEHMTRSGQVDVGDRLVTIVNGPNPYHTADQLMEDALVNGVVTLDNAPFAHPFWSGQDMADYMRWHDVLGHVVTGLDFTPEGESALFAHHARQLMDEGYSLGVLALMIEIVYRVSWITTRGWTWNYKPVLPGPIGMHIMKQLILGMPLTMPAKPAKPRPFMVAA